jgi:hypothetical protein
MLNDGYMASRHVTFFVTFEFLDFAGFFEVKKLRNPDRLGSCNFSGVFFHGKWLHGK